MCLLGPMVGQGGSDYLWSGSVAVLQLPPAGDGTVRHCGTVRHKRISSAAAHRLLCLFTRPAL